MTTTDPDLDDEPGADQTERSNAFAIGDAVIPLLRGVIHDGTRAWQALVSMESAVRDYVSALNLDLFLERGEGFAFLRRKQNLDEGAPTLLRRRPLTYRISLMLALLRRRMAELDSQGDVTRLVLGRDDLVELVRTYHPERSNETKLHEAVDADVNKLVEMGFCRRLRGRADQVEVLRVVKAFVDAEWLTQFDERLAAYAAHAASSDPTADGSDER
ncbi:MAG: DUF4194 domain-containing protein [Sporichthyaceae bacterium]